MKQTPVNKRGALLAALIVASCSQGPTGPSQSSSVAPTKGVDGGGAVTSLAIGDVDVGPNPINMNLVRVGESGDVPAFYANPGGEYVVRPGFEVEIYVQIWTSNPAVENPRLIVDWGDGEKDNIHCGPCRLSRTYRTEGSYTVKVTMDDRVSSTTTRTFVLNVRNAPPTGLAAKTCFSALGLAIPDNDPTGVIDTQMVAGTGTLTDLDVSIVSTHTWIGDLRFTLTHVDTGTQVLVIDQPGLPAKSASFGCSDNNINTTLDDAAGTSVEDVCPSTNSTPGIGAGPFAPNNPLAAFNGEAFAGTWSLTVTDNAAGDTGTLDEWCLIPTVN